MNFESDSTAELAAQIRAAVAATARSNPSSAAALPAGTSPDEETALRAMDRACAFVTPAVPDGAPLAWPKRAALRFLRFAWRNQGSFNALSLEAGRALVDAIGSTRRENARLEAELSHADLRLQDALARAEHAAMNFSDILARVGKLEVSDSFLRRRAAIQDGRLAALEAIPSGSAARPAPGGPIPSVGGDISPGVYGLFEERFRGTPEEIAAKQRDYLPLFENLPGPVLDVGCGRGEFLRLLAGKGIPASGVEVNAIAVRTCRDAGLTVEEGDGVETLASRPAASLGAVVALQVVEHWPPDRTFVFLREARRALSPGGLLLAETINVSSLSAWKAFYLDPSHVRPVPPEALEFLAEAAGFTETRIEYRAPLPAEERLTESSANDEKLNRLLFGPQDYALIARVPLAIGD